MITKEKVKEEIDGMSKDLVEKVYQYIHSIKSKSIEKKKIHTFKLKGAFDDLNIREKAYE